MGNKIVNFRNRLAKTRFKFFTKLFALEGNRMSILRSKLMTVIIGVVCSLALSSCGSSANNDQGTSFLALGFFQKIDGSVGLTGIFGLLNSSIDTTVPYNGIPDIDPDTEGFQYPFFGVRNFLSDQFIRVNSIDCDYVVNGSSLPIPSESFPQGFVAGPDSDTTSGDFENTGYIGITLVSSDVVEYLNNNIASLPEPPFRMTAICRAVGISQAGNTYVSNPSSIWIEYAEAPLTVVASTTGGDINVADPEDGAEVFPGNFPTP